MFLVILLPFSFLVFNVFDDASFNENDIFKSAKIDFRQELLHLKEVLLEALIKILFICI